MQTKNLADEKFEKLKELFPNAITESIDENGNLVRAIDKDVLAQEISNEVVEGRDERYQFTWPEKRKTILNANAPISKTLRPCREESLNFDETENLYIEGDNLEVLKLLQETYLCKVKMIYIDPPYNTGSDFVYNDSFKKSTEEYLEESGQVDEEGNRLEVNLESNGRFHTDWLNMIYPRLKLARNLLSDDGVIFISIDDNEQAQLKLLCDEIFGEGNFVSTIVVESGGVYGSKSAHKDKTIIKVKDYCLTYFKNSSSDKLRTPLYDKVLEPFDPRYGFFIENNRVIPLSNYIKTDDLLMQGFNRYNLSPNKSNLNKLLSIDDDIKMYFYKNLSNKIYKDSQFTLKIDEDLVKSLNKGEITKYKNYILMKMSSGNIRHLQCFNSVLKINDSIERDFSRTEIRGDLWKNFSKDMGNVGKEGNIKFKNGKKPVRLIKQLIKWSNMKDRSIVLDFFSGSATTAHAIMELNAEDGGNRKFIMVQLPEETDEKSEVYKAGYKNICEIGKERIRRAGKKILEDNKDKDGIENLDIGFRVLKTDTSNMKDVYYRPGELNQNFLDNLTDNIKDDRRAEDLLFQVMLDLGVPLSSEIQVENIDGKEVYIVDQGYLIACFDKDIDDDLVTKIAKKGPAFAIFRDSSMVNDSALNNFDQIFERLSPETTRRVI